MPKGYRRSMADRIEQASESRLRIPRRLLGMLFALLLLLFFLMGFLWSGVFIVVAVLLAFPAWLILSALLPLWKRFYAALSFWVLLVFCGMLCASLGIFLRLMLF